MNQVVIDNNFLYSCSLPCWKIHTKENCIKKEVKHKSYDEEHNLHSTDSTVDLELLKKLSMFHSSLFFKCNTGNYQNYIFQKLELKISIFFCIKMLLNFEIKSLIFTCKKYCCAKLPEN